MSPGNQEVSEFIRSSFRSVWDLELLSYLRSDPAQHHAPAKVVADLRASELVVANSVAGLLSAALIVVDPDGSVRYAPANPELDRLSDAVIELYRRTPDSVRRTIVSAASPGIEAFADAFRLRKD